MPGSEALDALTSPSTLGLHPTPVPTIVGGGAGEALLRDRPPAALAGEHHRPRLDGAAVDRLIIRQDIRELPEDLDDLLVGVVIVHPFSPFPECL